MTQTATLQKPHFALDLPAEQESVPLSFDIPDSVQIHIDHLLDYYTAQALKPKIKLIGDPLQVVSSMVTQLQKTFPPHLTKSGQIVLEFMIEAICTFCRTNKIGNIAFTFEFKR